MSELGWGNSQWGNSPWGGGEPLAIVAALATSENVVRVQFTQAVFFSGLLDQFDASDPSHFVVSTVPGTFGRDGSPVHPVSVVAVSVTFPVPFGVGTGAMLDLSLDRALSPFPARYTVSATGLFSADLDLQYDDSQPPMAFFGLYRVITPPSLDVARPSSDLGNPQTHNDLLGTVANSNDFLSLGTFNVDDTGDYALDSGDANFRKRLLRRFITIPGGFLHLGSTYGIGILTFGKKLGLASVISQICANAESQIAQEPEVSQVRVTANNSANNGLVKFNVLVRTKSGQKNKYELPVSTKGI